jgi:hypothetical protein
MKVNDVIKKSADLTYHPPAISVGDTIKIGKFKNRKATVKGFDIDKNSQPVLKTSAGERKLFSFRLPKLDSKNN